MSRLPRCFIGCTLEAKEWGESAQIALGEWSHPELWDQGFFQLSRSFMECLETGLPQFDFAVFVLTPDDRLLSRRKQYNAPRDNLVFELGLCAAFLGLRRTYMLVPKGLDLKLPTDLNGIVRATYDPSSPNKQSAMVPPCRLIRDALHETVRHPASLFRELLAPLLNKLAPAHADDVSRVFGMAMDTMFSQGVLRRNWSVDLWYDINSPTADSLDEHLTWSYDFVNITTKPIRHPMTLFAGSGKYDTLVDFTKTDEHGVRVPVPFDKPDRSAEGFYVKHQSCVELQPGVQYSASMNFVNHYPVSPRAHYVQNALAPTAPTLNAQIRVRVPTGYRVDVLGREIVTPQVFRDSWQFLIPGPLYTEQILEYVFQKQSYYDENHRS